MHWCSSFVNSLSEMSHIRSFFIYLFTLFLCVRTCAHTCSQLPEWTIFLWSPGNSFLWPGWASSHGGEIFFSAVIQAVAIIVAGGFWTLGPFSDFVSSTLQVICCQRPTGINSRPFKTHAYNAYKVWYEGRWKDWGASCWVFRMQLFWI